MTATARQQRSQTHSDRHRELLLQLLLLSAAPLTTGHGTTHQRPAPPMAGQATPRAPKTTYIGTRPTNPPLRHRPWSQEPAACLPPTTAPPSATATTTWHVASPACPPTWRAHCSASPPEHASQLQHHNGPKHPTSRLPTRPSPALILRRQLLGQRRWQPKPPQPPQLSTAQTAPPSPWAPAAWPAPPR